MGSPNPVTDPGAPRASDGPAARSDAVIAELAACGLVVTDLLAIHTRAGQVLDTRAMLLTGHLMTGAHWPEALLTLITPTTVSLVIVLRWASLHWSRGAQRLPWLPHRPPSAPSSPPSR